MNHRPTARRVSFVVATSLLAVLLLVPAGVSAAQANWHFYNPTTGEKDAGELLPAAVAPGSAAGYSFRIANDGPSNISQLFLTDSRYTTDPTTAVPVYLAGDRANLCQTSPYLYCAFGALNAYTSITITIAYATPTTGSSFSDTFQLNSTGATFSDSGKNSHGDTLSLTLTTTLDSSKNFDGGFNTDGSLVANNTDLGKRNVQSGAITPPSGALHTPVTVEDGLSDSTFSCPSTLQGCANRFGEWTRLNVDKGSPFSTGIKLVLTIWGPAVPSGATVDTINLVHVPTYYVLNSDGNYVFTTGTPYVISARCTTDGLLNGTDECITVTKVGKNFQIVAWLLSNGGTRSVYF